jgi:ABC-type multidrug transport system fused ATPase/permease subunit
MKRTAEKVLTWIGILFQILMIALMALALPFLNDPSIKNEAINRIQSMKANGSLNQGLSQVTPSELFDLVKHGAIIIVIIAIVCFILAIIMTQLMRRIPKTIGVLLILMAIVNLLTGNLITSLLWLIAGIMLMARSDKAKQYTKKQAKQVKDKATKKGSQSGQQYKRSNRK